MAENKKDKKTLNPVAIPEKGNLSIKEMEDIAKEFRKNENIEVIDNSNSNSDTYFREIIKQLYSTDNISMKSEYNDDDAVIAGASAEFIGKTCNVPMMAQFIEKFEIKEVSKGRKGRTEIILGLEKRQEEIQSQTVQGLQRKM